MDVTRAKGTVVIVGDVGLKVEREVFYRKEIDLLMSTSYGPGPLRRGVRDRRPRLSVRLRAVDAEPEHAVVSRPAWRAAGSTCSRSSIASSRSTRRRPRIARWPTRTAQLPLGVLIRYPGRHARAAGTAGRDARCRSAVIGRRPAGPLNYALVGAGAFGTAMLVPQMKKRRDRFFLQGRREPQRVAGRQLRARQPGGDADLAISTTCSKDPGIDLVVIATRHHEHADQVVRALEAGQARVRREAARAHLGRARSRRDASIAGSRRRRC